MNIVQLLHRTALTQQDMPAVALGRDVLLTYAELQNRVKTLAATLINRLGLESGDRVALIMRNDPAFFEVLFALWQAGLAAVPVNAKLHDKEFAYILEHSGAKACFATAGLAERILPLKSTLPELKLLYAVEDPTYQSLLEGPELGQHPSDPDALAWLFYTSCTTGQPKGAMLSHRNLWAMTASYLADVDQILPGDCQLHAAPLSHGSGLYCLPHIAKGACQVIPKSRGFEPDELLDLIAAWPGSTFFAAPTMVKRLTEAPRTAATDHSNLKTIIYGGGPMYQADLTQAEAVFGHKLVQIYGQGESPMTITVLDRRDHEDSSHPRHAERKASVGKAQLAVEVRITDDKGNSLAPGETGEVLVRGESVMLGYWHNPEATASTLGDSWLWTGDLGSMDEDGYLTLSDRSKDLIISGGTNIYPREVEEVLLRHPAISEVSVIGVPDPDWGESVVAFVVLSPGAQGSAQDFDAYCLAEMARFKRPKSYRFVDQLPKNNYGKILKTALRDLWAAEPA